MKEFVSGRDVFVSLPTGSGASLYAMLCYLLLSTLSLLCIILFRQMVQRCSLHIAMAVDMYGLLTHKVTRKIT